MLLGTSAYESFEFAARQTLGEEYTNLVLITPGSSKVPSLSVRPVAFLQISASFLFLFLFLFFFHISSSFISVLLPFFNVLLLFLILLFLPPQLRATMSALQACLPSSSSFLRAQLMKAQLQEDEEDSWDANRVALREAFLIFFRLLPALHLALFYLNGDYFHFAKRITGLRYVSNEGRMKTHLNSFCIFMKVTHMLILVLKYWNTIHVGVCILFT